MGHGTPDRKMMDDEKKFPRQVQEGAAAKCVMDVAKIPMGCLVGIMTE